MPTPNDKRAQDQEFPPIWQPKEERPERVIYRPLATPYVIPGRGNAPHQIDNDTKAADYIPRDDFNDQYPFDPKRPDFTQVKPPHPVPVTVVSEPYRSELNESYVVPLLQPNLPVPAGLTKYSIDTSNVQQLVAYDDTRVNIHIDVSAFIAYFQPNYIPALCRNKQFLPGTYYIPQVTAMDLPGKDAWYVAPFLWADQSAFGTFNVQMSCIVTTQRLINQNP